MSERDTKDEKPRYPSDLKKGEVNPYIPKYIASKPWYQGDIPKTDENDYLSHQRKNPEEIVDYSISKAGEGINDEFEQHGSVLVKKNEDYESKRDRWYGYDMKAWDDVLNNWENIKNKKRKLEPKGTVSDSDDTDYELELVELNLSRKDLRSNIKEDPLEKTIRDRQDVPSYIQNITSDPNNKIRIEYDPKSRLTKNLSKGFVNDQQQFVRQLTGEARKLNELQKFAWDIDEQDQKEHQVNKLNQTFTANDENEEANVNLDLNLEASPTLMMLKAKKHAEEQKKQVDIRKGALLSKYGANTNATPDISKLQQTEYRLKSELDLAKVDKNGLIRSRYPEDRIGMNHETIYGSYYEDGHWGYLCCKQTNKNAYCNK